MRNRKLVVGVALIAALVIPATMVFANHTFSDVPTSAFYHDAVAAVKNAKITAGCTTTKYCPNSAVTRGQMAVFLDKLGALSGDSAPVVDAISVNGMFIQGEEELDPTDQQLGVDLNGGAKSECATGASAGENAFNTYSVVYTLFATPATINPEEVNVQIRDNSATPDDQVWDICFYRITAGNLPAGRYHLYFQFTVSIGQGIFGSGASAADASQSRARAGR
jgi:hypothetical protein